MPSVGRIIPMRPVVVVLHEACARGIHADYAAGLLVQAGVPMQVEPVPRLAVRQQLLEPLSACEMEVRRRLAAGRG